ncbi:MAG: putative lipid II flippase FtsW [Succinivibrio sp.]
MKFTGAGHKGAKFDRLLLIVSFILICLGVMIISSASVMESIVKYDDPFYQTKRHIVSVVLSLFLAFICAAIPTDFWKKRALPLLFFCLVLMILVLIVGREINGAKRWLNLGILNIQPSEFLKLVWILYFSDYISRKIEAVSTTIKGFLKIAVPMVVLFILLFFQKDLGSIVVVFLISYSMVLVAGAGLIKYLIAFLVVLVLGFLAVLFTPYRVARVTSFLNPWEYEFSSAYQLTQSLMAFGRGGLFGEGLGNSYQKLGYLPEAHTDFITSIFGEEFGFIGMVVLISLEAVIVCRAFYLGIQILKKDAITQGYVAVGISMWICCQTFINVGSASGALPTKGLTLPLVSYGGSSLMAFSIAVAILLRIDYEWRNGKISDKR